MIKLGKDSYSDISWLQASKVYLNNVFIQEYKLLSKNSSLKKRKDENV